ncbi:MAG: DNA translocase FtsK [Planctomycetaceae bacterium]|nr:DNA translocase FtsK [Planctomycetaceae bacterium]
MLENRNLKTDLLALALLAGVIFLAAALLSYDPADPPSKLVFPPHTQPTNMCGYWGAIGSRLLFEALGVGAYYLLISLGAFDAVLLIRHEINQFRLRCCGWALSLVGVTALAAMAAPRLSPGPVIGSGGYLGATIKTLLQTQFASVGAYILAVSMLFGGLLLATDYAIVRLLACIIERATRGFGRGVAQVGTAYAQRLNNRRSDLDDFDTELSSDGPAVHMSGRPVVEQQAQAEQAHGEAKDKEEEKPSEDQKESSADSGKSLGSKVGISRPKSKKKEPVLEEMNESDLGGNTSGFELPSLDLLLESETFSFEAQEKEVRRKAKILEKTFADFGFNIRVVEIQTGPVIAQFEVELEAGLRLSKITSLADDLAIALRVPSVRIVAPLPGKNTVGIEVPNSDRQIVRLREVMEEANGKAQKMRIPIYLGKDVAGAPLLVDLTSLPHLLIAGRTGTGKSVCLNSIIVSMLMTRRPDEVRMLMIDPKMVELSPYRSLPHLMHPVVTDMRKAEAILAWAVEKMEERYHLLARAGVRHISVYNQLGEEELMERIKPEDDEERKHIPTHMPYIVIVADELADLMMTAAKEVEGHVIRLAQKSRAVGIHLVLATQKPTVDVITGLIKSNLPARIAFQVASRTDSRVVLDEMGADKLLGNGDMLFLWPGTSTLLRGQGTYLSDEEISRVIGAVATEEPQFVKELVQLKVAAPGSDGKKLSDRDELYESAIEVVIREGRGSVSLLQRALGIGYGRAARLIDFMAEDGIVGAYNGSQARDILITLEQWQQMTGQAEGDASDAKPAKPKRTNKIVIQEPKDDGPEEEDEVDDDDPPWDEEEESDDEDDAEDDEGDLDDEEEEEDADDDRDADDEDDELQEDVGDAGDEGDTQPRPSSRPTHRRWKAESA